MSLLNNQLNRIFYNESFARPLNKVNEIMEFRVQRCAYAESAFFYSPRQLLEWPRLTDLLYETGKEKVDS